MSKRYAIFYYDSSPGATEAEHDIDVDAYKYFFKASAIRAAEDANRVARILEYNTRVGVKDTRTGEVVYRVHF